MGPQQCLPGNSILLNLKLPSRRAIALIDALEAYLYRNQINRDSDLPSNDRSTLNRRLSALIEMLNNLFKSVNTLNNYVYCYITTDSFNTLAAEQYSKIQAQLVRLLQTEKVVAGWLGSLGNRLDEIISNDPEIKPYAFYLTENAQQSQYLMRDSESSRQTISLSSIRAWGKLQGTITSQLSIEFELDGEVSDYPLPALQNIRRYSPDPGVRKRAFEAEIEALESAREPLAACMNGVAGFNIVLNRARKREDAIHHSLDTARIDREALEAMLSAMRASFPAFRSDLHSKARRFGKQSLPWWDLFAPVGEFNRRYNWTEACEFVLDNFNQFSPEPVPLPGVHLTAPGSMQHPVRASAVEPSASAYQQSKNPGVLCNFDGSLDQVSTIAHE